LTPHKKDPEKQWKILKDAQKKHIPSKEINSSKKKRQEYISSHKKETPFVAKIYRDKGSR
jgi:hypothetical protein